MFVFPSSFKVKNCLAAELPQRGPIIVGGKPRYSVGDTVELNCTSLRSSPATNLTWYSFNYFLPPDQFLPPDCLSTLFIIFFRYINGETVLNIFFLLFLMSY